MRKLRFETLTAFMTVAVVFSLAGDLRSQCSDPEIQTLTAFDRSEGDRFGTSLSVSGRNAVIGSPLESEAGTSAGAVYLYRLDGGDWGFLQKITASDASSQDRFGSSVALQNDWLVVGARQAGDVGGEVGAAYLFHYDRALQRFVETQKLMASIPSDGAKFGSAVALDQDVLAVTSTNSGAAYHSGELYVYRRDGALWFEEDVLRPSDAREFDAFGNSVAVSGDAILVGAEGFDGVPGLTGSVYLFRYKGELLEWFEEQKIVASDGQENDDFGYRVALDGDLALVGAPAVNTPEPSPGTTYLYEYDRDLHQWSERQRIPAPVFDEDDPAESAFGRSVSMSGDVAVIGDPFLNGSVWGDEEHTGAAYLFQYDGAGFVHPRAINPRFSGAGDEAGSEVAVGDDVALVAWVGEDGACPGDPDCDSGAVSVFSAAEIRLSASPLKAGVGQTIDFDTCCGEAGDPVVVAVTSIDTSPVFYPVASWVYGADCRLTFDVTVPPGFAGYEMSLRSFMLSADGYPTESNEVTIQFL